MKQINEYFFGSEEIHPSDAAWFYGGYTVFIALTLFTVLATL